MARQSVQDTFIGHSSGHLRAAYHKARGIVAGIRTGLTQKSHRLFAKARNVLQAARSGLQVFFKKAGGRLAATVNVSSTWFGLVFRNIQTRAQAVIAGVHGWLRPVISAFSSRSRALLRAIQSHLQIFATRVNKQVAPAVDRVLTRARGASSKAKASALAALSSVRQRLTPIMHAFLAHARTFLHAVRSRLQIFANQVRRRVAPAVNTLLIWAHRVSNKTKTRALAVLSDVRRRLTPAIRVLARGAGAFLRWTRIPVVCANCRNRLSSHFRSQATRVGGFLSKTKARVEVIVTERSLVRRMLLLLLSGTITIYITGIAGLRWTSGWIVETTLQRQALHWIEEMEGLAPVRGAARREEDRVLVESRIQHFPEIAFVRYYDENAKLVRSYGGRGDDIPLPTKRQLERLAKIKGERAYIFDDSVSVDDSLLSANFVRVLSAIRVSSIEGDGLFSLDAEGAADNEVMRLAGYLDVGIDPNLHGESLSHGIAVASAIAGIVFFIFLLVGQRLIRHALAPLLDLQKPLARLARGETDVSVSADGAAEVVTIGQALNATIAALKERDATLRRLAEHDPLTGLLNRASFARILDSEIERVKQEDKMSALLFIDLDRFKYLNDALGHAGGDRVLVQVSDLIAGRVRQADVVARFGGDEFTVLLRSVSRAGAEETARSVNEILNEFFFVEEGQTFHVGCSIGVALITPGTAGAEEVMLQADTACYEAKSGGRNRYYLFEHTDQGTSVLKDVERAEQIKQALREDGFEFAYQPIISVNGAGGQHYEVLLRMRDEAGRVVLPGTFLPIAERFGLLAEIDRWVVVHALEALATLHTQGLDVTFSINLSGQAFEDPAIITLIKHTLDHYRFPPNAVVFEITEQIAVRYMTKARRLMQSLIESGCRFSLDDFGVGFSSFSYLKHFPVSYIKIDGSFIENLAADPMDQVVVKSIVQIAKAVGKEVIAEFVQDQKSVDLLREYGVDYLQGYQIGAPSETVPHPCFAQASGRKGKRNPGAALTTTV